jgi:GMP synthase-like glutamine amidotransferase
MKILVLEHEPEVPAGLLARWATARGHAMRTLQVPRLRIWPAPGDWDAVVSLGSDLSTHASPDAWIGREIEFLRQAHQAGVPVLGICFGGQALALALGGSVRRAELVEVGWSATESTDPELLPRGPWFRWHEDVFSVPPGARELARSDAGPLAFVSGQSIGLQFHPEADAALIREWIDGARHRMGEPAIDEHALLGEIAALADAARARAEDLFDRIAAHWLDFRRRTPTTVGRCAG